ncbi:MAG: phage major capsid protein [Ruminococcus sp.]
MFNKDKFITNLKDAFNNGDSEKFFEAMSEYGNSLQQSLIDTANQYQQTGDMNILASRGIRVLSSEETKFYDKLAEVMTSTDVKSSLAGADLTIPQTIIDTVLDDIKVNHPLLDKLNITNTSGNTKWIYSSDTKKLAKWGKITSAITEEISETIHAIDFGTNKLSAFILVPKDLLSLGARYLDAYVRKILADALAYGLEEGFVYGTGKDEPVGMAMKLTGAVDGVHVKKTAVKLKSFEVVEYMGVVSDLATTPDGKSRAIPAVDFIVNPADYLSKVVPATTIKGTDGTYKNDIFPYGTNIIQSESVKSGEAILGLTKEYIALFAAGKNGTIEHSDEYKFLEDERSYIIKTFAEGRAKDENCFILLDISELQPAQINVNLTNSATSADVPSV